MSTVILIENLDSDIFDVKQTSLPKLIAYPPEREALR
jgi:hypothetical protein